MLGEADSRETNLVEFDRYTGRQIGFPEFTRHRPSAAQSAAAFVEELRIAAGSVMVLLLWRTEGVGDTQTLNLSHQHLLVTE